MRKFALLLIALVLGLAGCGVELPSPVPTTVPTTAPTSPPPPTAVPEEGVVEPPTSEAESPASEPVPAGSAACVAMPFDFPVESRIPSISEDDHTHGPSDASITIIEYADFQ
ncbi:MAG: hypothetical protein GY832_02545 [Chloroflexi bacterium]|nr:hypothetical protein [Chloroflexota bacterium]